MFGSKIRSTPTNVYVMPTIISAAAWVVCFIVFGVFTNKFINAFRMYRANENLASTGAGMRLLTIRNYKTLYAYILNGAEKEENEEEKE